MWPTSASTHPSRNNARASNATSALGVSSGNWTDCVGAKIRTLLLDAGSGERASQQLSRVGAGVLAVEHERIAVDDGRLEPRRPLDQTAGAAGEIVDRARQSRPDGGRVEDVDVGAQAFAQ